MDPLRKLAAAVILQALRDAVGGGPQGERARAWILSDGHGWRFWCQLAGVSPQRARTVLEASAQEPGLVRRYGAAVARRGEIRAAIDRNPDLSNRAIAKMLGVNHEVVRLARR